MHGPIYLDEKAVLPITEQASPQAAPRRKNRVSAFFWVLFVCTLLYVVAKPLGELVEDLVEDDDDDADYYKHKATGCNQVDPLFPAVHSDKLLAMEAIFNSPNFVNISAGRLSGAVQVKTQSFDDMTEDPTKDDRFDAFPPFHQYLEKTFPLAHSMLKVEKVNTLGLLYTWNGSDSNLKPTLLMAHQDTVPVPEATLDQWTYPPWSGHYDGKYVWGRGASDCKNQLIGVLEAIEALLAADYAPKRTILLSFGFDEEVSGPRGAGHLHQHLLDRYGKDSIAVLVDEGMGISEDWGVALAQPGVAEKGYTDVIITIRMPGGHSSVPPDHTAIGVMSELITMIEAHPYETHLDSKNPYLGKLQCGARFGPEFPKSLRKLLPEAKEDDVEQCKKHDHKHKHGHDSKPRKDELAIEAAKAGKFVQYLMQTSVAVDIIAGGVKVNALPERVQATVNHRVNIGEHPQQVHDKVTKLAEEVAKKYNLTVNAFPEDPKEAQRSITLTTAANKDVLEPAPVTPTNVDVLTPYAVLSGTTRALYGDKLIMAPGLMTGNTDTRYFWDLTPHIFRWGPAWSPGMDRGLSGVHTVDERMDVEAHINGVKWFAQFVRNMDEAEL